MAIPSNWNETEWRHVAKGAILIFRGFQPD
jgi:hypothetical protein